MKKKNSLLFAALILLLLAALYLGITWYQKAASEKAAGDPVNQPATMTNLEGTVTKISFQNGDSQLSFTLENGKWYCDSDKNFPLDQSYPENIARIAKNLAVTRTLENGDSMDAYGLTAPQYQVSITDDAGNTAVILIGESVSDGYYAKTSEADVAYTISDQLVKAISHSLNDMIALEEFPHIEGSHIQEIQIKDGDISTHLIKKKVDEEGYIAWYRNSAQTESNRLSNASDANVLADNVSSLAFDRCYQYQSDEAILSECGLATPDTIISYYYENGNDQGQITLYVGDKTEDNTSYFAKFSDSNMINEINTEAIDSILNLHP